MTTTTARDTIMARRSVRAYEAKKLDKASIQRLLNYAVRAPTAMHQEPCVFVVIQNQSLLEEILNLAKPMFEKSLHAPGHTRVHTSHDFSDPNFSIFYGADTLIVILAKLTGSFVEADCWLAAENLMITATEMGLGSCVIGSALMALNTPEIKAKLTIPTDYSAVAPIIIGFPDGVTAATSRNEPMVLSWIV